MPQWLVSLAIRWGVVAAVGLAIACAAAFKMHEHDQVAYDKLAGQYHDLNVRVKQAGEDYKAKVAEKEKQDGIEKIRADQAHAVAFAAARDELARLRVERDDERGKRFLAERPASSKCPDGQVCFDGALFRGAYRRLVEDLRAVGDRGTAVEQALKSAMDWAHGN